MNSMDIVEGIVKSNIPPHMHDKYFMSFVAYNRDKLQKGSNLPEGSLIPQNRETMYFQVGSYGYSNLLRHMKHHFHMPEGGFRTEIRYAHFRVQGNIDLHIPCIDFNKGLEKVNIATNTFWDTMRQFYPNRKLYLMDSGSAHHGIMNALFTSAEINAWFDRLSTLKIVDQGWVSMSLDVQASRIWRSQIIRTTSGPGRPEPKLWKWVNL